MTRPDEILNLISEQERRLEKHTHHGLVIQPGAIGDCILTLPMADYLKSTLELGKLAMFAHISYAGMFMGRTCIDLVRSLDSAKLHRLFLSSKEFQIEDMDPLLTTFMPYNYIASFMGQLDSDFEKNLIFTAHCTHSAEITVLEFKSPSTEKHISQFYIDQVCGKFDIAPEPNFNLNQRFITPSHSDVQKGLAILADRQITENEKVIVICPGAGNEAKCWPMENFLAVAAILREAGFIPVFVFGPAEQERISPEEYSQFGQQASCITGLALSEVLAVLSVVHAFLGNDSGISHLAGAMGLRTVAVFGPTPSSVYRPLGPLVSAQQIAESDFKAVSSSWQQIIAGKVCES